MGGRSTAQKSPAPLVGHMMPGHKTPVVFLLRVCTYLVVCCIKVWAELQETPDQQNESVQTRATLSKRLPRNPIKISPVRVQTDLGDLVFQYLWKAV